MRASSSTTRMCFTSDRARRRRRGVRPLLRVRPAMPLVEGRRHAAAVVAVPAAAAPARAAPEQRARDEDPEEDEQQREEREEAEAEPVRPRVDDDRRAGGGRRDGGRALGDAPRDAEVVAVEAGGGQRADNRNGNQHCTKYVSILHDVLLRRSLRGVSQAIVEEL